jgi:hypothetical protein
MCVRRAWAKYIYLLRESDFPKAGRGVCSAQFGFMYADGVWLYWYWNRVPESQSRKSPSDLMPAAPKRAAWFKAQGLSTLPRMVEVISKMNPTTQRQLLAYFVAGALPQLSRDMEIVGLVQPDLAKHWSATEEFLASLSKAQIFAALDEAKFNWKSVKADLQEGRAGEARSALTRQGEVAAEGAEGVSGDGTVGLGRVMGMSTVISSPIRSPRFQDLFDCRNDVLHNQVFGQIVQLKLTAAARESSSLGAADRVLVEFDNLGNFIPNHSEVWMLSTVFRLVLG